MINITKRLGTARLEFSYAFPSGVISGVVDGEYFPRKPNVVFNLKNLNAKYVDYITHKTLVFDQVYGQCSLDAAVVLFSGSSTQSTAVFSLSYRGQEAVVFDGDNWLESGWNPAQWSVHHVRHFPPRTAKTGRERPLLRWHVFAIQSA